MKIIGLKVEGVRLLKAFQMKFQDKGLTQIRGKNKQGKSTVIDCLELLLRGNKIETKDMISHGKDKAEIVGQIDNYIIKRVLKKEGANSLEVRDVDSNMRMDTKPQDFLDSLINELTFNPLPWLGKSSDEKLRFIQNLTGLDLTAIDAEIEKAKTDRYDAGVLLRNLGEKPKPVEKVGAVSVTELLEKLDLQKNREHDIELASEQLSQCKLEKVRADEDILKLESDLKMARTTREQAIVHVKNAEGYRKELPQPNIEEAQSAVDGVEAINEKANTYAIWVSDYEAWVNAYNDHKGLEIGVKNARTKKDDMLKKAKMPINGMEIKEDGLYFDGTHCENWSDSEGYEIALNVCLAMKPELKAIFIDRGELFDADGQKALQEWAEKHDIQIGIAIVDDDVKKSADGVFYIVEGEVQ